MNFIHPTAVIGPNVTMGDGNYIGPFCIIGGYPEHKDYWDKLCSKVIIGNDNKFTGHVTVDAGTEGNTTIGNGCWFLKHSHVGHDVVIDDDVTVSCGAKIGGHTKILQNCNIGLNAVIHQRQFIEEGCMIGMGAVVTKGLITEAYKTYAGNPAKLIGENTKHPNYPEYTINMKETL